MGIRVALHHRTQYTYDRLVSLSPQVVRLRPAPHSRTPVTAYSMKVSPGEHFINWQLDPYSNYQARLVFPKATEQLTVEIDLVADMTVINPFDFFMEEAAEKYPFTYDAVLARELTPYLEKHARGPRLSRLLGELREAVVQPGIRSIDVVVGINQRIHKLLNYIIRMEPGVQSPEQTLELGRGSCRDFAWLMVNALRHMNLAARFVSGYSIQLVADQKPLDGPAGVSADCCDLHAWAEVYLPGAGWIGLDATSGLMAAEGHIPLACAADPTSAAPITGSYAFMQRSKEDKVKESFNVTMSVRRVHEDPRVTKPYTPTQWQSIEVLGERIDRDLKASDVRLTMGGEPTFVSIDDMDGAEWNTEAVGPTKRRLGEELLRRLQQKFAPGALLHFGQGKWYPGEQLPRWALACYWRKDGQPVWEDANLIADSRQTYNHAPEHASLFMNTLAHVLDVDPSFAIPGYEDTWYYLWRERRLPTNVDPFSSNLDDPLERKRLARVFEQGLSKVVGYCLPLARWYLDQGPQWVSGAWFLRPDRMYLIPGDSPMGYRLPLDSLPWAPAGQRQQVIEQDPMEERDPLPPRRVFVPRDLRGVSSQTMLEGYIEQQLPAESITGGPGRPRRRPIPPMQPRTYQNEGSGALVTGMALPPWVVRTAVCVEPRQGMLHVFMPPARYLEDYLDLVAAVEYAASTTQLPVVIEGYHPPFDSRLNVLKVTPDPGVIEVNLQPAHDWKELTHNTTVLYDEARQTRLGTEKFMIDGRHTGTGGGNHVVIGGATPADSPFLRRPDLLKSMVAYWHNHPSLSYLFSSLFIGPTSQAPRADEGRSDATYELEIALQQIPDPTSGRVIQPWLVDRVFRHVLTDLTGNTHRAEFCIDKLYNPDGASGRLGLVEFRGFEMPPHAQMSLTQQLLLRGLIARFWDKPYEGKLVKWGTQLYGRFMLPHWVEQDFEDVVNELAAFGYPFKTEWFAPHLEFRYPRIGQIVQRGIQLELRTAMEPWHVLGEEPGAGGTVRFVDSSVERVQVKIDGMIDTRHVVTCNGRRLPLHSTGVTGQYVAGVRYRAWQPGSCLHPTIGVQAPLVFDVYDNWSNRTIGGCKYHVAHPGGRSYEKFPVNAAEAESRRVTRFFGFGHTPTPGWSPPPMEECNDEYPFTLDLRRL